MSVLLNDDNGGPAFPTPAGIQHNDGMTLRDYFAAEAIKQVGWFNNFNKSAATAYAIADAMIKVREAKP